MAGSNYIRKCPFAGLLILAGCAYNYVPADANNPPSAGLHSDRVSCARSADGDAAVGAAVGMAVPIAGIAGAADMPGYYDRLDACMRERGWLRAESN